MSDDQERCKLRKYVVIASSASGDTIACDPIEVAGISNLSPNSQVTIASACCESVDVYTDVKGNWYGSLSGCTALGPITITASGGGASSAVAVTCNDEAPITEEGGEDDDDEQCAREPYNANLISVVRIEYNAKSDTERLVFVLLPEFYETNKSEWMLIRNQSKVFEINQHARSASGRRMYRAEFRLNALRKTDRVRMILCDSAGKLTQYTVFRL